jgi:CRISPR/Cas system-associated exonuclease Cas4 (RecB family)
MATATTLVLKNNADVNVNYYPIVVKTGEYAKYVDRTQGVLALQPTAALAYSETSKDRRVSGVITYPTLNATTGLIETSYGRFEYTLVKNQSSTDRLETRKRLGAMIADAITSAAVDNGETPW